MVETNKLNHKKIIENENSVTVATSFVIVDNNSNRKNRKSKAGLVLLDPGSSGSLIAHKCAKNGKTVITTDKDTVGWNTPAGVFKTKNKSSLKFKLDEFSSSKQIKWVFNVAAKCHDIGYDMIIGLDLLTELGLIIDFDKKTMSWAEATIEMHSNNDDIHLKGSREFACLGVDEPASTVAMTNRATCILDVEYTKADLPKIVEECTHLDATDKNKLLRVLIKYKHLFDGTLGDFKVDPVKIELKKDAQPVQLRPFQVPHIRRGMFKKELDRLIQLGVLEERPNSPWSSPSFLIAKKDGQGRFLSDFRKLNNLIVRKPFPIPVILDVIQTLEGFKYATTLDLNMGYYTLRLDPMAQDLCTIITPWGKYAYLRLTMGLSCAPDIFQQKMSSLMQGLEFVHTYLDDILVLSGSTIDDHLEKLCRVFDKFSSSGLRVHIKKCKFCAPEVDYLGYLITREGVKPQARKIEAIQNLGIPRTVRDVRRILGIIQYYRDMWPRREVIRWRH